MTLKTWANFSKKINSTLQPTGQSRDYTVYLKENTSLEKPVFILGTGIDAGINYCQCFGNYYFVDDIVMISADQVEVHCTLDVLATHKTAIGAYTCHIRRSASAHDPYLIDEMVSQEQVIIDENYATTELWPIDQSGCYIIRIVGEGESPTGITSYVLTPAQLNTLLSFMFDDGNFVDELSDTIVKTFFNPFQYIVSLMWFPLSPSSIPGTTDQIHFGWWYAPGQYKKLTSVFFYNYNWDGVNYQTVNVPTNFYQGSFKAYHPSYTQLNAFFPGVGTVDLDPMILSYGNLKIPTCIDWVTGNVFYRLQSRDNNDSMIAEHGTFSGQVGVPVPIGQLNNMAEGIGAADGLARIAGGIAAYTASALTNISPGSNSVPMPGLKNLTSPTSSILGNAGNRASITSFPRLCLGIKNFGCGDDPTPTLGKPLCRNRQINTLSGYVQCNGASIALAAPDTEVQAVNNYLNTGFYYE